MAWRVHSFARFGAKRYCAAGISCVFGEIGLLAWHRALVDIEKDTRKAARKRSHFLEELGCWRCL